MNIVNVRMNDLNNGRSSFGEINYHHNYVYFLTAGQLGHRDILPSNSPAKLGKDAVYHTKPKTVALG